MRGIGAAYGGAVSGLTDVVPGLGRVRSETLSVLFGETAGAAEQHFGLLFDGEYSVERLAGAVSALGASAAYVGSEIEYVKLSIVLGLGLAAYEISRALAWSEPTGGASLGWIRVTEAATVRSFRRLVGAVLGRVADKVAEMVAATSVKQLLSAGGREAIEELLQTAGVEGAVARLQGRRYNWDPDRLVLSAVAAPIGGAAGGASAVPVAGFLGAAGSRSGAAAKTMVTITGAGVVGNVAAAAATGGPVEFVPMLASSVFSGAGGLRGTAAGMGLVVVVSRGACRPHHCPWRPARLGRPVADQWWSRAARWGQRIDAGNWIGARYHPPTQRRLGSARR